MKAIVTIVLGLAALAAIGGAVFYANGAFRLPSVADIFAYTYKYDNGERFTAGNTTISVPVKNMDIDWVNGNVTVDYHDDDTVLISETSKMALDDYTRLHWCMDGDKLIVKFAKSGARIRPDLGKDIVITLPRSAVTESAVIDNTTGDIFVKGGSWSALGLSCTTGSVNLSADSVDDLTAHSTTGNVNIDVMSTGTADLHCTTGDVILVTSCFDSLKAKTTTGDIRAKLPEKLGFTATLSATTGDVSCAIPHTNSDKTYTVGDGSRTVEMKATTGNVSITG